MQVDYRTPTEQDAEVLSKLGIDTFVATFGHLYASSDLNAFLSSVFSLMAIRNDLVNLDFRYRVASDMDTDDGLIGYCKVGPLRAPVETQRNAIEIRQLYVREPYFGTGVAPTLMKWALNHCEEQGAEEVYLSVWSENVRAIRFYERFGFSQVGTYNFMVGNHADHEFIFRLQK